MLWIKIKDYIKSKLNKKCYDPKNPMNLDEQNPNGYLLQSEYKLNLDILNSQTIWDKLETIYSTRPLLTGLTYSIVIAIFVQIIAGFSVILSICSCFLFLSIVLYLMGWLAWL